MKLCLRLVSTTRSVSLALWKWNPQPLGRHDRSCVQRLDKEPYPELLRLTPTCDTVSCEKRFYGLTWMVSPGREEPG